MLYCTEIKLPIIQPQGQSEYIFAYIYFDRAHPSIQWVATAQLGG